MAVIGELATLITARTEPFTKGLKVAGTQANTFSNKLTSTLGGSLRKVTGLMSGTTAALAGLGGGLAIGGLVVKSLKLASSAESMQTSYAVYLKDLGKARKLISELDKYSGATPFQSMEIKESGKQLLAFGFNAENLMGIIRVLGDVAAGSQKPIADFVDIMGKVKASGVAAMGDINRLADRGVPIFTELSKVMGVSTDKVRSLVGEGKVGFDELWQSMKNVTEEGGLFQGAVDALSKTTSGKLSTLKDNVEKIFTEVGTAIIGGLDLKAITDELTGLAQTYKQDIVETTTLGIDVLHGAFVGIMRTINQGRVGGHGYEYLYHRGASAAYGAAGSAVNFMRPLTDPLGLTNDATSAQLRRNQLSQRGQAYESQSAGELIAARNESDMVAQIMRQQRGGARPQQQEVKQTETLITIADRQQRANDIAERQYMLMLQQRGGVVDSF